MSLNLYLLERPEGECDQDELDAVVVAAATPKQAREMVMAGFGADPAKWAHGSAKIQKIGVAVARQKQGVILLHIAGR